MKLFIATLAMLHSLNASATTYCNPDRSKPCGGGCISLEKTCRKSWTTSKVGINPNKGAGKGYENPVFVTEKPKDEK